MPDIDIDLSDRDEVLELFKHIPASRIDNNELIKHNTGVYMHEVPVYAPKNICSIPYKDADKHGYFKLDFLNVSIYKDIKNEEHLNTLMNKEPLWDLLEHQDFVDQVFHLSGHSDLLKKLKPTNVEQLAATLAIIRPAKRHLADETWTTILKEVWIKPKDGAYYFKKAHSFSYAFAVIVHMNLLCEQINETYG